VSPAISLSPRVLGPVAVGDRHPAILAERLGGDADAGGQLAALVLGRVDQPDHRVDHHRVEPVGHHLGFGPVVLDVRGQHRVEHLVGGQALVVSLVRPQLGRGRLLQHRLGDRPERRRPGPPVPVLTELVDLGLRDVLDRGEPTDGVAVQGEVTGGDLALVAGGEHDPPVGIGDRHQQQPPQARLEVLVGQPDRRGAQHRGQHVGQGPVGGVDRDDPHVDA
jgi:hypothetical protein